MRHLRPLRPGRVLAVARQSAALLRAIAPNRDAVPRLGDEVRCDVCQRWRPPLADVSDSATTCTACLTVVNGPERGWLR